MPKPTKQISLSFLFLLIAITAHSYSFNRFTFDGGRWTVDCICNEDDNTTVTINSITKKTSIEQFSFPSKVSHEGRIFTVTSIDLYEGTSSFKSIHIPASISSISDLNRCYFYEVTVDADSPYFKTKDGILYDKSCSTLISCPSNRSDIVFPDNLSQIEKFAFRNSRIKKVVLPSSITHVGGGAFDGSYCQSIDLSKTQIEEIKGFVFSDCYSLTEIKFPSSLKYIQRGAFWNCRLKAITLPSSVCYIGESAFHTCDSLTSVSFFATPCPATSITIEREAFVCCGNLSSITFSPSVTSMTLGEAAFLLCESLTDIALPSVNEIPANAFAHCYSLQRIVLPPSVTSICDWAFRGCSALKTIWLPPAISIFDACAFSGCSALSKVYCTSEIPPFETTERIFPSFSGTLYIPKGSKEIYELTPPWHYFWDIEEYNMSGTDEVDLNSAECKEIIGIYDCNGRQVTSDYHGMVIVKYADGSVCKQLYQ